MLNKYINQEEGMSNQKEDKIVLLGLTTKDVAICLSIGIIILAIVLYFKYDKEIFVQKQYYCREIPDGLEPEEIQYIYNHRKIKNTAWITFLGLVNKGVFTVKKTKNKVGKEVLEIEDTNKAVTLKKYQSIFLQFIQGKMHNGKITDLELKAKLKNGSFSRYREYVNDLKKEVESLFGEENKAPKRVFTFLIILMIGLIGLIIYLAIKSSQPEAAFGIAIFLGMTTLIYTMFFATIKWDLATVLFFIVHCGAFQMANIFMLGSAGVGWMYVPYIILFIVLQYAYRIKKAPKEEREIVEKAKGLKRYIRDYSLLKDKNLEDVTLWENYLILAIALGLNKKVIDKICVERLENSTNNMYVTFADYAILDTSLRNSFYNFERTGGFSGSSSGSSYSGSSGGFSGGSSSGGRRRRWWTEVHHSKYKIIRY